MEVVSWSRYGDLANSCLSFASWLWGKQHPLPWATIMMYFWALHRHRSNGITWWNIENSKVNRQYKSFLFLSWFPQVFCHNDRNLINTGNCHFISKSSTELKKLKLQQLLLDPKGCGRDRAHWCQSVSFYYTSLYRKTQLLFCYTLLYY
jgi:hypothetical protein